MLALGQTALRMFGPCTGTQGSGRRMDTGIVVLGLGLGLG